MGAGTSFSSFGDVKPLEEVTFKINGKSYTVKPDGLKITLTTTINTFIRDVAQLKGTKMMCLEGGCGSCIVNARFDHPVTKKQINVAVNSCLVTILSCHNWEITTVEGIGDKKQGYHMVQSRLAQFNGTQCGFCSPGMVMNMYSLYQSSEDGLLTQKQIENSFGGNICRCTGYRSIADGFKSLASDADPKLLAKLQDIEEIKLCPKSGEICKRECASELKGEGAVFVKVGDEKWFKVYKLADLWEVLNKIGDMKYMLVAGNTGHGVVRRPYDIIAYIDINSVPELHELTITNGKVTIGANTTLTEYMQILSKVATEQPEFFYFKEIHDHIDLVANVPVRNVGTIAGNLMIKHGYRRFQSDVYLTLETFEAQLEIRHKDGTTKLISPKEFLDLDMNGRVIVNVIFQPFQGSYVYRTYKIMGRAQNVHAIVNAGFLVKLQDDLTTVVSATIVYGAINTDFTHATKTEAYLVGKPLFDDTTLQGAYKTLESELDCDLHPPDPSPEARKALAISLFYKFILSVAPKVSVRNKSGGDRFERGVTSGKQEFDTAKSLYPLTEAIPKIEALVQCSGEGRYVIDVDTSRKDYVYGAFILARKPAGYIVSKVGSDVTQPGVIAILTAKDIPGRNSYCPPEMLLENREVFCSGEVKYNGQPIGLVLAETEDLAYRVAESIEVEYQPPSSERKWTYTVRDALRIQDTGRIRLEREQKAKTKGSDIKKVIKGTFDIGSQYHYTMETQACVSIPVEDGLDVFPSSQWIDACQVAIAKACNLTESEININCRRIGGGYGAKLFPSNLIACASSIAAVVLNRPVYLRMRLEDNMDAVGKRFPCSADYETGVDDNGKIQYLNLSIYMNYGYATNEANAPAVLEHAFNVYDISTWDVKGYGVFTDITSHTYCRAPGSTEGIAVIESIMDHIALELGKDPRSVRLENLVQVRREPNPISGLMDTFGKGCKIDERIQSVTSFNKNNRWRKRGIGVALMNYPFEYYGNFSAMVSVFFGDGTVQITHGGIEMGQGINTKVQQVAAYALGIDIKMIQIKPTSVLTSPNCFGTGGSTGSESVCFATIKACEILLERMAPIKKKLPSYSWAKMVQASHGAGINLSASYQMTAHEVQNYNIYGVTFVEVEIDLLTGLHQILRVDLLEDTGDSMSPEIDVGQVEGAFVMGLGYWLSERIDYDPTDGKLLNTRTWTYHPPGMKDIPIDWRIEFRKNAPNPNGVLRSKATGEPPLCMSVAVIFAIRQALAAARLESNPKMNPWFPVDGPTSTDVILLNSLPNYQQYTLT